MFLIFSTLTGGRLSVLEDLLTVLVYRSAVPYISRLVFIPLSVGNV
jgi:hypothetical protein